MEKQSATLLLDFMLSELSMIDLAKAKPPKVVLEPWDRVCGGEMSQDLKRLYVLATRYNRTAKRLCKKANKEGTGTVAAVRAVDRSKIVERTFWSCVNEEFGLAEQGVSEVRQGWRIVWTPRRRWESAIADERKAKRLWIYGAQEMVIKMGESDIINPVISRIDGEQLIGNIRDEIVLKKIDTLVQEYSARSAEADARAFRARSEVEYLDAHWEACFYRDRAGILDEIIGTYTFDLFGSWESGGSGTKDVGTAYRKDWEVIIVPLEEEESEGEHEEEGNDGEDDESEDE